MQEEPGILENQSGLGRTSQDAGCERNSSSYAHGRRSRTGVAGPCIIIQALRLSVMDSKTDYAARAEEEGQWTPAIPGM